MYSMHNAWWHKNIPQGPNKAAQNTGQWAQNRFAHENHAYCRKIQGSTKCYIE